MSSRSARLAADIQAVVAADYIRNLREEAKRGIEKRLEQGFLPCGAPVGYLDAGKAKSKTIRSGASTSHPLGFRLVHRWALPSAGSRGVPLRTRSPKQSRWQGDDQRPFASAAEPVLHGLHPSEVEGQALPRCAQAHDLEGTLLQGPDSAEVASPAAEAEAPIQVQPDVPVRYLRTVPGWIARERRVYYRCATMTCPMTSVREDAIDERLRPRRGSTAVPRGNYWPRDCSQLGAPAKPRTPSTYLVVALCCTSFQKASLRTSS